MSTLRVDNLKGKTTANTMTVLAGHATDSTTTTNLEQGLCKSWINFNGTGTIATRDSFNVTGITDNGTGDHSITIANDMNNTNYCHAGSSGGQSSTSNGSAYPYDQSTARTATLFRVLTFTTGGTVTDPPFIEVHVMGDLA